MCVCVCVCVRRERGEGGGDGRSSTQPLSTINPFRWSLDLLEGCFNGARVSFVCKIIKLCTGHYDRPSPRYNRRTRTHTVSQKKTSHCTLVSHCWPVLKCFCHRIGTKSQTINRQTCRCINRKDRKLTSLLHKLLLNE